MDTNKQNHASTSSFIKYAQLLQVLHLEQYEKKWRKGSFLLFFDKVQPEHPFKFSVCDRRGARTAKSCDVVEW